MQGSLKIGTAGDSKARGTISRFKNNVLRSVCGSRKARVSGLPDWSF